MDLEKDPSNELNRENAKANSFGQFVSSFLQELSHSLFNNKQINSSLQEDTIYVVNGIQDEELSIVNIKNGEEFDITIVLQDMEKEPIFNQKNHSLVCAMKKEDFYPLELGNKLVFQEGILLPYEGEIHITNNDAWDKLEDLFFNLEQEEGRSYQVTNIVDNKIYMEDNENQGHYEVYQELYPDWKIGDTILRKNGKYQKKGDTNGKNKYENE